MVMLVVTSLTSSYAGTICLAQEAPAAILGLLCASLSGPLAREMPPQDMVAALIVAIAASTIRSEEHTSELQSLMRISYAVFCLKKKKEIKVMKYLRRQIHT